MKKSLTPLILLLILAVSCSKNNPGNTPPPVIPDKYMTTTVGSTWNYETTDNAASTTSSYILTSTNRDSTINAKSYHVYLNSGTNGSEYYNISAGDYYRYQTLPGELGGSREEILYLKDNVGFNTSW
ncbi:MAG: hypothetical protein JSU03_12310 [Bacteroidetes bacterium]|nr:hypothetical protein [Bacteroidota bacterium]